MIKENVNRRLSAALVLLEYIKVGRLRNAAKSAHYRAVIIIICSVVEGLVYELIKKHTTAPAHIVGKIDDHKELHKISASIFSTTGDLVICEEIEKDLKLDDYGFGFGKMNMFLRDKKIITIPQYDELTWVQKERNRIHVQGLTTQDTGYTKAKVERIASIILILLTALK